MHPTHNLQPLVSIGVAVCNEERFLSQTLDSLLAQDYSNFEIIICDNASTDKTGEIAQEYAKKDNRIKYYLNESNIGGTRNFNKTFLLSSGKYFMWAGGHDLYDKSFISSCVEILEKEENVILVYALTHLIDNLNNKVGTWPNRLDTRSLNPLLRYHLFFYYLMKIHYIHGLMRRDSIKKTGLFKDNVLNSENIFLSQLSLMGEFVYIPKFLFYYRIIRPKQTGWGNTTRYIKATYGQGHQNYPYIFYILHQFYYNIIVIYKAPVAWYYKPILVFILIFEFFLLRIRMAIKNSKHEQ